MRIVQNIGIDRIISLLTLILNLLLLPCSCIPVLFCLNIFNPFQTMFITDIHITNATNEMIWITPIGTVGEKGKRSPLPIVLWEKPWMPASKRGAFQVLPTQSIVFYYDWDDINFSEIVVQRQSGELLQLVVDPNPTEFQYSRPRQSHFIIDDFARLGHVSPEVQSAYNTAVIDSIPHWQVLLLFGLMMLPSVLLVVQIRVVWARKGCPPGESRS